MLWAKSLLAFRQVFNGCPLKIHCTASWIHPETHNQHILVGAEEGIYTLNLNEIHENAMDLLYPRRTTWMFVIKDVLMTLSGKSLSLFRHDLLGLHSKQTDRLTISMNAMHKIPSKFVPKKFTMTAKVPNTKGCSKCCVGRNPYNGYKYLCGATAQGVFLMQWYDPLSKFMLLKVRIRMKKKLLKLFALKCTLMLFAVVSSTAFRVQSSESSSSFRDDHHPRPGVPHRLLQRAERVRWEVTQARHDQP